MRRVLTLTALAFLVISSMAYGQAQRGTIEVTVTDSDGGALPGASVSARSDDTLTRRTVFTDGDGRAQIVALDPATNYVVNVSLEGFSNQTVQEVVVRAGQTQLLDVQLGLAEVTEELIVTAEAPLVDVTKTQAGQDITLELTESLPTARSYQDYLQLVPGVQDGIDSEGNPASRSGMNYRDVLGNAGRSTDNLYYFDGINTTDRTTGTFGANLNTEIIQEQSVLTGAIPAEFVGVPGLVSNVVTKSGGNAFSGSLNYYFQDDGLVEDNDHFANETFSSFDTAFTLGGPLVRDKAWFFVSYRLLETERDVANEDGVLLRTVTDEAEQGFGKLTWAISDSDVISGSFMSDPQEDDGSSTSTTPNSADFITEQGGDRYTVGYNRVWGSSALELAVTDHEFELNFITKNRAPANSVSFAPGVDFSSDQETLGGSGSDDFNTRGTEGARASFEYLFDTSWGDHSFKMGYSTSESILREDEQVTGDPPAEYLSLSPIGRAVGLDEILAFDGGNGWSTQDFGLSTDETGGFRENLTAQQTQTLLGLWDDNNNGVIDDAEIFANMTFNSTNGNPNGLINYTRDLQTQSGVNQKGSEADQGYIQDAWQSGKWSVNAGVRWESWDFLASTGDSIGTFDDTFAPRLSIAYDINGDGRSSVGLFYGEYYDAFRDNAASFAGTLTGAVTDEQVYVDALGEWVTFRVRGGATVQDAFFAPRIETPVTEEIQLQYKRDLGRNMMAEINLIDRETSDIAEDFGRIYYDIAQYSGAGDPNAPDTFFLGPGYFGFPDLATIDQVRLNYMIGTLPNEAFRDYQGVELIFRKRYSNNWQMLSSYNWADADGNSNSDSNFDGAGDVFPLDPRAPGRTGVQPGLVEHLFKMAGSYNWDNGFKVGASYRWNSGVTLNRSGTRAFSRNIPDLTDNPFPANGFDGTGGLFGSTWIAGDAIGFIDGSSYGSLDARVSYIWSITDNVEADFFLDIFNVFDDQQTIRVQDLEGGGSGFAFLEGMDFVQPRRYYLGARLRF